MTLREGLALAISTSIGHTVSPTEEAFKKAPN